MAIVKLQPDEAISTTNTLPHAIQEPNKSTFTALVPESKITSLLKYIEGYSWSVNYYGQILNTNNTLSNFDPTSPNLNNSYYEVLGLTLSVSNPLSSSYDANSGITTVTGSAITPFGLIPNVGDIFIAQVDSGEDAIFVINLVSRKTYRKNTVYDISYSLYAYTSTNQSFLTNLKNKVQNTFYFNNNNDSTDGTILIKPKVKEAIDRLNVLVKESQDYYFSTFASKEYGSIYIPGVENKVYDPLLLNFIEKIVDISILNTVPFFKHNYGNNIYLNQKSILDILFTRNKESIVNINKKYKFGLSSELPNKSRLGTLWFTGASYVLYPVDPITLSNIGNISYIPTSLSTNISIKNTRNYYIPNINIQAINTDNMLFTKPLVHELFLNDTYIVTDNFYNYINDNSTFANISFIEYLIYKHITKKSIAKEDLVIAIERYNEFSVLHQLYLLPILWLLIKANQ